MRGLLPTALRKKDGKSSSKDGKDEPVQGKPRKDGRGFFVGSSNTGSLDIRRIIWTVPPIYPFDRDDPGDNTGFIM